MLSDNFYELSLQIFLLILYCMVAVADHPQFGIYVLTT